MTAHHPILYEIAKVLMGVGVIGFFAMLQFQRQRAISNAREHKANIQTLFNGKK
jgi:hypothetical protein